MILSVTLNPAWDITHTVDRLDVGNTHRVTSVGVRPGGKGVNVSRVLQQLGHRTVASGLLAGSTGEELRATLAAEGLEEAFFCAAGPSSTRRTVSVVETGTGRATVLAEPGPTVVDWPALSGHLGVLIEAADLAVLSGSLPPGVPADAYGQLVAIARRHGTPVIVDADGAALGHAVAAGPDVVKPNLAELAAATGLGDPWAGACQLVRAGAARVVVSGGPDGLYGVDAGEAWRATPPRLAPVNPTGAGDAAVAALAVGLLAGWAWPELLSTAVAWSAAAVLEPLAGSVDPLQATMLKPDVTVVQVALSLPHGRPGAGR